MNDLSQYLRDQRKAHRLSLEDLAHRAEVDLAHLEALEAGRFDRLPSATAYGMLRRLANVLRLNGTELVSAYQQYERAQSAMVRQHQPAMAAAGAPSRHGHPLSYEGPRGLQRVDPNALLTDDADAPELRHAKLEAQALLTAARREAEEIRQGALAYADQVLQELEGEVSRTLGIVQNGREFLQGRLQQATGLGGALAASGASGR